MPARTLGALVTAAVVLLVGCQPRGGGGGTPKRQQVPAAGTVPGYNPVNQPAVNQLGTPGPVTEGGRFGREGGGPNAGAHGNPPPEGYRGSGSTYNPPSGPVLERQKLGNSPAPSGPASTR